MSETSQESVTTKPGLKEAVAVFRYRDYSLFWFGALLSNTGSWMQNVTIPFVIFQLTGSAANVGVTGFFQFIPIMLLGPIGGALADRFSRRMLLFVTQAVMAAVSFGMYAVVASGRATPVNLTVLAFAYGLAGGLNIPIWQAFVSQLVPRRMLLSAITLNSTQFNASRALGPFLAGPIIFAFGVPTAMFINFCSFGAVLVALLVIRAERLPGQRDGRLRIFSEFVEAVRYARGVPGIVACFIGITAVAGLGSPLFAFLPVVGEEVFGIERTGATEVLTGEGIRAGLLYGAAGLGSVLFAPLILGKGAELGRSTMMLIAMLTYGVATAAVGLAPSYGIALVALLIFGGAYLAIAASLNTTIQLLVREDMRGKTLAVYIMFLTGALPIGLIVWGQVAEWTGISTTAVMAGALLVVVTIYFMATGRLQAMGGADEAHIEANRS